ncbi:MAG: mobilization protein [Gammaproteobacteria bacterium]|nr:mobilization protein [Gammaproteobacteria bacterium]
MATGKRRSDEERLEELDRKKAAIEARQKALRARVAKKERARDTRRKILIGAFVLHQIESGTRHGPGIRKWLQEGLPGFLRETDRKLFDDILEVADSGGENAGTAGEKNPVPADSFQTEAN